LQGGVRSRPPACPEKKCFDSIQALCKNGIERKPAWRWIGADEGLPRHPEGGFCLNRRKVLIWTAIILGFLAMEFPGILLFNRVEPFVGNLPFIYAFTIIMWAYMCIVLFVAHLLKWGGKNRE
jgi:hypothetical protein